MTILATGGAGFIGGALVRRLTAQGRTIGVIDSLTYASDPEASAILGDCLDCADIRDEPAITEIIARRDPDAIIHLAAESHVDRSIDGPAAFIDTNIGGTRSMLDAALSHWRNLRGTRRDAFRFVHISTDEVFGSLRESDPAFHENSPYRPRSPYAASKAASDHLVRAWAETYGLPVIVVNCTNNYGPRQFPEKLIPLVIARALAAETLPVYGDGGNVRDWLHVDDHVEALIRVLDRGRIGATYTIGGLNERTNIDVVRLICKILDRLRPRSCGPYGDLIRFVADRPGHDRRYAVTIDRMRDELGWTPAIGFEDGLADTVRWYLDNPGWIAKIAARGQGLNRLGLNI